MTLRACGLPELKAQSSLPQFTEKATISLKRLFGDSITVQQRTVHLTADEKKKISEKIHSVLASDTIAVLVCLSHNKQLGYGVVDNVKGKTQLITYLVATKPDGTIADVDVLAYRESYGGEIAYDSFRKQFRNKTSSDEFQPGKDIKNVSGATISVRAITFGTKRIVATLDAIKNRLASGKEEQAK